MIQAPPLRISALAAAAAALWGAAPAAWTASLAVGDEFRVNDVIQGNQTRAAAAADDNGDFVVAWEGVDANGYGVYARLFDPAGQPLSGDLRLNATTVNSQQRPAVAMDPDGDFVAAWESYNQDGTGWTIVARRFDRAGLPLGAEINVPAQTTFMQRDAAIALDAAGGFVVSWTSTNSQDGSVEGIYARRFDSAGQALGGEIAVNQITGNAQFGSSLAMRADGQFVVVWQSTTFPPVDAGVFFRRFDANGNPLANEAKVNVISQSQGAPGVAMDADGNFVVAYSAAAQYVTTLGDIYARRYSAAGLPDPAGEIKVNVYTSDRQFRPVVASDAYGNFVVAWESVGMNGHSQDGSATGVFARQFDASGAPLTTEYRVNKTANGVQRMATVAASPYGNLVVAWESQNSAGQDGSGYGIYGRRYTVRDSADLRLDIVDSVDPVTSAQPLVHRLTVTNQHLALDAENPDTPRGITGASSGISIGLTPSTPLASLSWPTSGDWTCLGNATLTPPLTCRYAPDLPASQDSGFDLSFAAGAAPAGGHISLVGQLSATTFDPRRLDNRAVQHTRVVCADSAVHFAPSAYTVAENAGTAVVTVERVGSGCGAARVQIDVEAGGTATPGADYDEAGTVLSWNAGETGPKTFGLTLNNDQRDEADETLVLVLGDPDGVRLDAPRRARMTLVDDDPTPRINFTARAATVSESAGLVRVTTVLSAPSGRGITVPLLRSGSAAAADVFLAETALDFAPGQSSATLVLEVADDATAESTETLNLSLGTPVNATAGTQSSFVLTVNDND